MNNVPSGWIHIKCPKCAISLVVQKISKDAKRCGVCEHIFKKEKTSKKK